MRRTLNICILVHLVTLTVRKLKKTRARAKTGDLGVKYFASNILARF